MSVQNTRVLVHHLGGFRQWAASPEKKFLYLKVPKVAGTSIARGLMRRHVQDLILPKGKMAWRDARRWLGSIDDSVLDDYFKFTFVRNPWDRLVSVWTYFHTTVDLELKIQCTFREFVLDGIFTDNELVYSHAKPQTPFFYLDGEFYVDFVGRYETLDRDWATVAAHLGLPRRLPQLNVSIHKLYAAYYDDETREVVRDFYREEIELLNYEFLETT